MNSVLANTSNILNSAAFSGLVLVIIFLVIILTKQGAEGAALK